ncbi:MAG: hypothetical protein KUG74_10730 [Rhodobacteraceae bacterium]|nr:hypothetical protein [Paracoccaceae bacterium]
MDFTATTLGVVNCQLTFLVYKNGDMEKMMEHFEGTIVRVDGGGFGIVHITGSVDRAEHAFFTENTANYSRMNGHLKVGSQVAGVVERTMQRVLPVAAFEVADK